MEEALIILPRSRIISWPLAGRWCGAQELCSPGTGAGEGIPTIKSPPAVLGGMGNPFWDQYETSTSSASGWDLVEDALLVGGRCRLQGWQEGPVGQCPVLGVPFPGWASTATAVPR